MHDSDKRVEDRRKSSFDFRKNKVNNRKGFRRRSDKINYSIYYIVIAVLSSLLALWFYIAFNDVIKGVF